MACSDKSSGVSRRSVIEGAVTVGAGALLAYAAPALAAPTPPAPTVANPDELGFSAERLQRISDAYQYVVAGGELPGAVVLIARNNRLAYARAFGFADREKRIPMRMDLIFRIRSMSKIFTSLAAMMLAEDGRLSIAAPVEQYLPEFKNSKVGVEKRDPNTNRTELVLEEPKRLITVQDLLRHTSGIVYGVLGQTAIHKAYAAANIWPEGQMRDTTLEEMVKDLAKIPLAHQPGEVFEYGHSTDVLGRVIEVASGRPLNQFIDERIVKPLNLTSTGFTVAPNKAELVAYPSPASSEPLPPDPAHPSRLLLGGAGMFSTGPDYLKLCLTLLNGGAFDGVRLISPKTVELMSTDALPPNVVFPTDGPIWRWHGFPSREMGQGFGLGFAVRTAAGRSPLPGSVGQYFWGGSLGTQFFIDPAEKLVAVQMIQVRTFDEVSRFRELFIPLVYQAMTGKI